MRALSWTGKRGWTWEYTDGDRVLATLRIRGWTWRGELVTPDGRAHTLAWRGLMRWRIEATDAGGAPTGRLDMRWRGDGTITLPDGRWYDWRAESLAGTRFSLRAPDGRVLARVEAHGWWRWSARVEVEDAYQADALALPLALGWYATVVSWSSAVVATT